MKILFYPREKCKYAMTVISGNDFLSDIFGKRYDCQIVPVFYNGLKLDTEDAIFEFLKEISINIKNTYKKETISFYYNVLENKAFYLVPEETKINTVDFSQNKELLN